MICTLSLISPLIRLLIDYQNQKAKAKSNGTACSAWCVRDYIVLGRFGAWRALSRALLRRVSERLPHQHQHPPIANSSAGCGLCVCCARNFRRRSAAGRLERLATCKFPCHCPLLLSCASFHHHRLPSFHIHISLAAVLTARCLI